MSENTIDAMLDALAAQASTRAMSEEQLVLNGYHRAIADVRATLANAAGLVNDDGNLPDYIRPEILVVRGER